MTIKPLSAQGLKPSRFQGLLHPWARLGLRLSSFLFRLLWCFSCCSIRNSQSEIRNAVGRFPSAPLPPFSLALLFPLLLFFPSDLLAQPGWGPDQQVSYLDGSAYFPQLAVSGETLHVVWDEFGRDSLGTYEDIFYIQSMDTGAHWTSPRMLSDRSPKSSGTPSVALQGNEIHVVWCRFSGDVCYRKSTDGGLTWGPIDTTLLWRGRHPRIAMAGDSLYLVAVGQNDRLTYFRKSTNRGTSWLPAITLGPGWQWPQVLVQRNLVHVFAEVLRPYAAEVYYARSTDGGQTWASMWAMSSDDDLNSVKPCLTGIDTLAVYAVWMDQKYSPYSWTGDIFIRRSLDGGVTWAPEESLTVEHRAWDSDAIAQGDTLHLVSEDDRVDPGRNFELFYRMSTDRGLSWDSEIRLTYAPMHSRSPSLGFGSKYLHLVWADGRLDTTYNWSWVYHKRKVLFPSGVEVFPSCPLSVKSDIRISPNPARTWVLIKGTRVGELALYDVAGRLVRRLALQGNQRGSSSVLWDCRNEQEEEVKSGVYFLRFSGSGPVHKVVVVR